MPQSVHWRASGRHPRRASRISTGAGVRGDREAPGRGCAARADDDPDADQPPGGEDGGHVVFQDDSSMARRRSPRNRCRPHESSGRTWAWSRRTARLKCRLPFRCSGAVPQRGRARRGNAALLRTRRDCVEIAIVDGSGTEVPRRTVGEIAVRGPNMMHGYWNKPEQTQGGPAGRRVAAHRRWRLHGRARVHVHRRPGEGHDRERRRERLFGGGRECNRQSSRRRDVRGNRHSEQGMGRGGACGRRGARGAAAVGGGRHRPLQATIAGYKCPKSVEFRDALPLSGAGKVLKRRCANRIGRIGSGGWREHGIEPRVERAVRCGRSVSWQAGGSSGCCACVGGEWCGLRCRRCVQKSKHSIGKRFVPIRRPGVCQ